MILEYIRVDALQDVLNAAIISLLVSFLLAFPVIFLLYKFNVTRRLEVDFSAIVEDRQSKAGKPIMGGIIIVITVILLNLLLNEYNTNDGLLLVLAIFALSALLGGFDDLLNIFGKERKQRALSRTIKLIKVHKSKLKRILLLISLPWEVYKRFFFMLGSNPGKGIQAHEKILVQSIAGLALGFGLYYYTDSAQLTDIWLPILDLNIDIGILFIPFAWISVILMTNAVNLADGMDGLSSTELLASFLGFLVIALLKDDIRIAFLIATVIGSLISYLYFNIPPARFEMGDVGSLALGALLASCAFILREPMMLLIISFPFVLTLSSSVIQGIGRRVLGRRIFKMAPIHHHLQIARNWSEEKVVFRLALLSIACTLFGLWIYFIQRV